VFVWFFAAQPLENPSELSEVDAGEFQPVRRAAHIAAIFHA